MDVDSSPSSRSKRSSSENEIAQNTAADLRGRVIGYRGGYTKEDRRRIERDIFNGEMLGIVATNALEVGIDIGSLECTLHLGIPDTYTSLLQQVGRCGRAQAVVAPSLVSSSTSSSSSSSPAVSSSSLSSPSSASSPAVSIIICSDSPIDQFYSRHPHLLFQYKLSDLSSLNYSNFYLHYPHLLCALKELGLDSSFCRQFLPNSTPFRPLVLSTNCQIWNQFEMELWGEEELKESLQYLWREGCVSISKSLSSKVSCHPSISNPFKLIHLRAVATKVFQIFSRDSTSSEPVLLEVLEYSRAFYDLYLGAIYLHQGMKYLVVEMNLLSLTAYCQLIQTDYHTIPQTRVIITSLRHIHGNEFLSFGLYQIHCDILGFHKIWSKLKKIEWGGELQIPPVEFGTCGLVVNIPSSLQSYILNQQRSLIGSLHIVNHAILIAIQLFLNCDISSNLETEHWTHENISKKYRLLFYDKKPGGLGASEAVYNNILLHREQIFTSAQEILLECSCLNGCPSCVLDHKCLASNGSFDKIGGILLLHELIQCLRCGCDEIPRPVEGSHSQQFQQTTFHEIALAASKGVRDRSMIFHEDHR